MRFYVYEGTLKKAIKLQTYDERREFNDEISISTDRFNSQLGDKGNVVRDTEEFDPSLLHDGEGIHFFLSRAEAERFEYKSDKDKEDSEEVDDHDE